MASAKQRAPHLNDHLAEDVPADGWLQRYDGHVQQLASLKDQAQRLQGLLTTTQLLEELPLSDSLALNRETLQQLFAQCVDWVWRDFRIAGGRDAAVTYLDGLVNLQLLEANVIKPLLYDAFPVRGNTGGDSRVLEILSHHVLVHSQLKVVTSVGAVVDAIVHADAVLLVDGEGCAFVLSTRGFEKRNLEETPTEAVIRGPREAFVEDLRTNTALVRRRIRSPYLKIENLRVGRFSRTDIAVAYIRGIAVPALVDEVKRRIGRIDIDGVIDSAYIEELIEDDPYSPFPQVLNTERPDVVAAQLLEGRVAILVDGSPSALVVPITLWSLMQASEDYYERYYIGTALRILRYLFGLVALLAPSLYVAITTFHQEMIPTALLLTVAASREGIPFPSVVEALMMEIAFEVLREAGVRLPRAVGQAVSIVGALVIGQAAVQAGIVSAPMVIIVATTGIASFTFPRFNLGISVRLLRFPMILLAATLGLYGIMIGLLIILIHLCGLRSFGVPYTAPATPLSVTHLTDVVARPPIWLRRRRPRFTGHLNPHRQAPRIKPGPPPWEKESLPEVDGRGGEDS